MKPRIYVETSVISYIAARPSRNALTAFRQELTRRWWEKSMGIFSMESSELVRTEIASGDASASKRRLDFFRKMRRTLHRLP